MNTLEELKINLEGRLNAEWKEKDIESILEACYEVTSTFELSEDEIDYVIPIKLITEDQSNQQTLINAQKASAILLKRKKNK